MVADIVRRLAVRDVPEDLAFVEIDGADARIWRFQQRQSLHSQPAAAFAAGWRRGRGLPRRSAARFTRRGGGRVFAGASTACGGSRTAGPPRAGERAGLDE